MYNIVGAFEATTEMEYRRSQQLHADTLDHGLICLVSVELWSSMTASNRAASLGDMTSRARSLPACRIREHELRLNQTILSESMGQR